MCLTLVTLNLLQQHCAKIVLIQSFSGPYFPAFGQNTERYSVSHCSQSEYGKIQTQKTPNMDTFRVVISLKKLF